MSPVAEIPGAPAYVAAAPGELFFPIADAPALERQAFVQVAAPSEVPTARLA